MTIDERLEQIATEYGLATSAVASLRRALAYQAEDEHASTTVRDPERAVDRHVADSLAALTLPEVRDAGRVADLGSGAGWPGVALAAALPDAHVSLVESADRRCRYLRRLVEAVGLANADVVHARAETWADGREECDVVTARALAALPVLCEYAAPLLRAGGTLVAWKGDVEAPEAAQGDRAAVEMGLRPLATVAVHPYPGAGRATLRRFRKVAPTPERFPRRPGMATKRPLGA